MADNRKTEQGKSSGSNEFLAEDDGKAMHGLSVSLPLSLSLSLYCSVLPRPLYSIWTLHNQSQIDIMF